MSVCVCVCVLTIYLKNYLTNQLHLWWEASLWPRDEVVRFWEKSNRGKGGVGWRSKFGPNDKRYEKTFNILGGYNC